MNHNQKIRYSRHLTLPEIGEEGQEKLLSSKVLVVGAGGLGSPSLLYLAAAGIGNISIADGDKVELSNLQRQILHETYDIGQPKVDSAKSAMHDLNPEINIKTYNMRLDENNIDEIIANYDVIIDGSDNFATRLLLNDKAFATRKPLISAAIGGFSGQISTFKAYLGDPHPCYRCIYPNIEHAQNVNNCSESGVLGAVAGLMGSWQAIETVKEILQIGKSLSGWLVIFDALSASTRKVKVKRNKLCKCCG